MIKKQTKKVIQRCNDTLIATSNFEARSLIFLAVCSVRITLWVGTWVSTQIVQCNVHIRTVQLIPLNVQVGPTRRSGLMFRWKLFEFSDNL